MFLDRQLEFVRHLRNELGEHPRGQFLVNNKRVSGVFLRCATYHPLKLDELISFGESSWKLS